MPQPSDIQKATRLLRASSAGGVIRQYRPVNDPSLPQTVQDAFRQMPDQIYSLRQQFGPKNVYVQGQGNPITITTSPLGAGLTMRLTRPGVWVITASVALSIVSDNGQLFTLSLVVDGARQGLTGQWNSPANTNVMMHQAWQYISKSGSESVVVLIEKDGGSGTSAVNQNISTLTALYAGTQ